MRHLKEIIGCSALVIGMLLLMTGQGLAHTCSSPCPQPCNVAYCKNHGQSGVTCSGGYDCQRHYCTQVPNPDYDLCCVNPKFCQAPVQEGTLPTAMNSVIEKAADLIAAPARADVNCSGTGGECFGFRDGVNRSGSGTTVKCAAQLHVCFIQGIYDSALSGVDTENECNNACDTIQSPSQIACSYLNCQDRCHCGLAGLNCPCD